MSSHEKGEKRAVDLFEEALERLEEGKPINLPLGTPVSLSNVAKEAGRSPSALRSERYPELIRRIRSRMELERRVKEYEETSGRKRNRKRQVEERLADCVRERDRLQSICHSQQELIDELHETILQLEQGKKPLAFPGRKGDRSW